MNATQADPLIEKLTPHLTPILDRNDQEAQIEKTWQYVRLRRVDLYLKGSQYLVPSMSNGTAVDLMPIGMSMDGMTTSEDQSESDQPVNIMLDLQRKFVSATGLRPFWECKAIANDPQSAEDKAAQKQGDALSRWLDQIWQTRRMNLDLCRWLFSAGRVYGHIALADDRKKFGVSKVPTMGTVDKEIPAEWQCPMCGWSGSDLTNPTAMQPGGCPQCGASQDRLSFTAPQTVQVPQQTGEQSYPNLGPVLKLYNAFMVTVPPDATSIDDAAWLRLEYEQQPGKLLQIFGEQLRQKMGDDNGSADAGNDSISAQGIVARAALNSVAGVSRPAGMNRWTYSCIWITTQQYEWVKDKQIRAELYAQYPDGLKVSRVSKHIMRLENEALSDVWTSAAPESTPTLYCDPYAYSIIGYQDSINDLKEIMLRHATRKIPTTIAKPQLGLADLVASKQYTPGAVIEAAPAYGGSLSDGVQVLPTPNGEITEYQPLMDALQNMAQNHIGMNPRIWGAGPVAKTAEDSRNQLNQALAQIGPAGEAIGWFWAESKMAAVNLIRRYGLPGEVRVATSDKASEAVDLEALRAGKFTFEPEIGVPLSYAEKRDAFMQLASQNPDMTHALGFDLADNLGVVRDFVVPGMPELKTPDADAIEAADATIEGLLEYGRKGFVAEQNPQTGQWTLPDEYAPDQFVDRPDLYSQRAATWARSKVGRTEKTANPNGYKLVLAWGLTQQGLIPPPPPQPNGPNGPKAAPAPPPQPPPMPPPPQGNPPTIV